MTDMDPRVTALIYSFLAALATFAGIQLLVFRETFARKYTVYFISFAAGIILAVAFLHLIPEAAELNPKAIPIVLAGFVLFYLIESVLIVHACPMHQCEGHGGKPKEVTGQVAFLGLCFHSLVDGIIIGIGFEVSNTVGLLTALSIILHKLPEGVSIFSVLIHSLPRKQALVRCYIEAAATPVGTLLAVLFIPAVSLPVLGVLLAVAAGSFIYIAASDLIPETHEVRGLRSPLLLLMGIVIIAAASLLRHG